MKVVIILLIANDNGYYDYLDECTEKNITTILIYREVGLDLANHASVTIQWDTMMTAANDRKQAAAAVGMIIFFGKNLV